MNKELAYQYKPIFRLLLLIIFTLGLHSCEFDSNDDNYVHVEKPKDEIQLGIDLAGVNPKDIIYVYNNSSFGYTLYTDNKDVLARQFFLDGNPIETNQQTGIAFLNTNITDKEIHELKLVIGVKTGSESLAEYAGLEMYTGEFSFKIKFIPYSDKLNIRETKNSGGNLKLEWDKPTDFEVTEYRIYKGDYPFGELLTSITNPDETSFVDLDYAYGYKSYTIVAKIKNSFNLTVQDNIAVRYWTLSEDDFETYRISTTELQVKWTNTNPFPCKYVLTYGYNGEKMIIDGDRNEVVIPINNFPDFASFTLYILPESADIERYKYYSYVYGSFREKEFRGIDFVADTSNKQIQLLDFSSLSSFDATLLQKIGSAEHNLRLHTGCQVQVSKEGKVAIEDADGYVHIYSNSSLKTEIARIQAGSYPYYPFCLIDNNKILIEEQRGFKLYNMTNYNVIASKKWESSSTSSEVITKTSISSDGKYVYVLCKELFWATNETKVWTELLEIENNNVTLLEKKNESQNIQSISFNPVKPAEAIMQYSPFNENRFVIVNITTKEKKEIKGEFMNIDPFTGNILYRGEEYRQNQYNLYVRDKNYTKEIIKINLSLNNIWAESTLINSNLFFNGYYLDLRSLKEWNQ